MRRALALSIIAHLLLVGLLTFQMQHPPTGDGSLQKLSVEVALQHAGTGRPFEKPQESLRKNNADAPALITTPIPSPAPAPLQTTRSAQASEEDPVTSAGIPAEKSGNQSAVAAPFDAKKRNYLLALSRHMMSRPVVYPRDARERGVEGTVIITFTMDRAGNITSVTVSGSSGDASLDAAALAAVRKRSPMPPPPPSVQVDGVYWDWPVPFRIE